MNKKILIITITLSGLLAISFKPKNIIMNKKNNNSLVYVARASKSLNTQAPLLILLHGHGGNENDLFGFASSIPEEWNVVSVRGPYQLAENSYRWYDVKMENGKITINIVQEEESRKKLLQLINDLSKKYNVDNSKVVIAGFSQGANMAQSIGIGKPKIAAGFGVFSGRFVEEFIPFINKSSEIKNIKGFISHSTNDNMLPITFAIENRKKLKDLGISITFSEDVVAHTISPKQFSDFIQWLKNFK